MFQSLGCVTKTRQLPSNSSSVLNDNGVEVYSISIELINGGKGVYCNACGCPSGRKIVIRIPETDIEAAEQVGFTLVQ